MRAPATSAMAVAWGTPSPSTPRVVQALPGPTPTSTPTAPVRMRCRPAWYEAHPPTITGMSNSRMKRLRLSGSDVLETCSAETTVPWMTRMSSSAARQAWASDSVRWGVTEAAVVMPASFICLMRAVTSSGMIGSWYICCMRDVAFSSSSSRISSKSGVGSS